MSAGAQPNPNLTAVKPGRFLRLSRNLGGWPPVGGMGRSTSVVKYAPTGINRWSNKREGAPEPVVYMRFKHIIDTNCPY